MLLIIETSTALCSVALCGDDGEVVARADEVVGRGHAERLIPMISALPGGGRASEILVNCGPGSFTGIRVGIAAARGLGLGWQASVTGYSVMALQAWCGFEDRPDVARLTVINEAGHGALFVQDFVANPFAAEGPLKSQSPDELAARESLVDIIGSGSARLGLAPLCNRALTAADAIRLPKPWRSLSPSPIYGRAPDAKLPT